MIQAAQEKKFQILLCKSQSRFTRDMELVEKYIHGLFPIWGIRFIAVADNADTEVKGNKKARQINGLVNEWYLEDLSENIRMVFDMKRRQGQYIGGFPIYGYRKDPFTGKRKFHGGIDLHARGEQVLAMMEGVVVKVGQDKTSGKYVTLRHGNYTVSYCHLSRVLTAKGTVVRPRDAVGITGSTGRSTGEHLHITCKLNGKSVDPSVVFDYIRTTQQECISALSRLL